MGLREAWLQSGQVIGEEHDERAELINLRVTCAALAAVSLTAFAGIVLLVLLPLSGRQLSVALGLLLPAMLVAGTIADTVAARRYGRPSRELQRAVIQRGLLLGVPLMVGLGAGLAELAGGGDGEAALRTGLALMLGTLIGLSIHLWRLTRGS